MIAIAVSATRSYAHALMDCVRSIVAAATHREEVVLIFATDTSDEMRDYAERIAQAIPRFWGLHVIRFDFDDDAKSYNTSAQLRIAALQGACFHAARVMGADMLWSVESDNVVPANALRVLEWAISMPKADGSPVYGVAAGTYYNGAFLGGYGDYTNPIMEDFLPEERVVPDRLKAAMKACKSRIEAAPSEKEFKRHRRLMDKIKRTCPPDGDNVWGVNAKHGWRRRGWLDNAYPAIGEGALVPSDWCGLGCTLLGKHALALADFHGYEGEGTQDLFLCFHRWRPAGIRIACLPHILCTHVKREGQKIVNHYAFHEPLGECKGHIRLRSKEYVPFAEPVREG